VDTTSTPTSSSLVRRFDSTERWLHWGFAVPFMVAMATGLMMYFSGAEKLIGNRELVRVTHRFAGLATIIIPLIVLVAGDRRALRLDLRAIDVWSADDRLWLRTWAWRRLGGRDNLPPQGRFNAGQKFNAVLTGAAVACLAVTGILIFPGIHPPFFLVGNGRSVHNLAWILFAPVLAGHIYLAALYGPTRPGLRGMVDGLVPRAWLRQHHPLAPELEEPDPAEKPS
jgi:formate dehydrogenase subunit gamma